MVNVGACSVQADFWSRSGYYSDIKGVYSDDYHVTEVTTSLPFSP